MLKEGDKAPSFTLPCGDKSISLKDFSGKSVVLYFYPKDLTPGCTQQACDFRDNLTLLKRAKTVVLGVSRDSIEKHGRFAEKYGLTFPLLSDEDGKVCEAYGVWKKKSLYGRSFMGIERSTFLIGPNGKIKKIFRKVKVKDHMDEVLAALKSS